MRTTSSPRISALNEQPTPQYAQVVTTECSGWPIPMTDFSVSVAVAHAARAHDAFSGVVREIRVGLVLAGVGMLVAAVAVAHIPQADGPRHVLQLAVAVRRAGETIERVVGDVKLHDAFAQALQSIGLGAHRHSGRNRGDAGRRRAGAPFDLDQTEAAGTERLDHVGGAQFRNLRSHLHGGAHDRGALQHRHRMAVDGQRDSFLRPGAGRAVVDLVDERHHVLLYSAAPLPTVCVIPGRHEVASPESITTGRGLWIPGSPPSVAPRNDAEDREGTAPKSSGKWVSALITG